MRWRHAREGSAAAGGQGRGRRRLLIRVEEKRCECGWPRAALAAGGSTRWARRSRWTSRPRDDARNGRRGFGTHGGMRFSDEYDLELRRTTRGAGRRYASARRGAPRSEARRTAVGDGAVAGRGHSRQAVGGLVRANQVALGRLGAVRTAHGAPAVRQERAAPLPPSEGGEAKFAAGAVVSSGDADERRGARGPGGQGECCLGCTPARTRRRRRANHERHSHSRSAVCRQGR